MVAQALSDFKPKSILVYTILNGKGGLTICGPHEYSLASILFLTGQSNRAGGSINRTVLLVSSMFVCFVISVYYS